MMLQVIKNAEKRHFSDAPLPLPAKSSLVSAANKIPEKNPYINQYMAERNNKHILDNNSLVADPQEEEKIAISVLTYYYEEDVKTGNILSKLYKAPSLFETAISLKKEDKIFIMKKIKDIYSSLKNQSYQETLKGYLQRYAQNSNDAEICEFLNEISTISTQAGTQYAILSFSGSSAATWAYNNYNQYNTNFPDMRDLGGDCTNFVSQALNVGGGMSMQGDWYCYKKNSTYPKPANTTQLNYSWTLADPSPWCSVTNFRSFLSSICSTIHLYSYQYYIDNHTSIYNSSIALGDVVLFHQGIFDWITWPSHAMIISQYDTVNHDFKLAGHSNERQAYPLIDALNNNSSYVGVEIFEIP